MKRHMSLFLCSFLFIFTLTQTAHAQKFSKNDLKKMSTFISNFTETFMWNFNIQQIRPAELIDFGVAHTFIKYEGRRTTQKGNNGYINGKWVKDAIKKYFDYNMKKLVSTKEYRYDGKNYIYAMGGGEGRNYARVTKAKVISKNVIEMKGYIYNAESDERTGQTFVALAKPHTFNGVKTWSIISLSTKNN